MDSLRADLKQSVLGGSSSCLAVFFSNPFDNAKTRLMLQRELISKGVDVPVVYRHVLHCITTTARLEGYYYYFLFFIFYFLFFFFFFEFLLFLSPCEFRICRCSKRSCCRFAVQFQHAVPKIGPFFRRGSKNAS